MNMAGVTSKPAPRTKWLQIGVSFVVLLLIMLATDMMWVRVWQRISIGYTATRLAGPLRPDRLVNYAAALDAKYGRGVTEENYAVPLLMQAAGVLATDNAILFEAGRKNLFSRLRIKMSVTQSGFRSYYRWVSLKLGNVFPALSLRQAPQYRYIGEFRHLQTAHQQAVNQGGGWHKN